MTAVYTLAHSCLQQDSPLSVSPSSVHSASSFSHHYNNNKNSSIARRSSLSNSHHHTHHHHVGSPLHSGFSPSSSYQHQASLPMNIEHKHQQHSHQMQHVIQPVPSPILSVSPPKQQRSSLSSSSYTTSLSSSTTSIPSSVSVATGNSGSGNGSGISNLFKHHATPANDAASVVTSANTPAAATAQDAMPAAAVVAAAGVTALSDKNNNAAVPLPRIHSLSVIDTFAQVLSEVDIDSCEAAGENAFLICDLGRVYSKYLQWQNELGSRIEPFFAVKCNPDPLIIKLMVNLGIGFDCASHQEISSVLQAGALNDKIIYANPCKASSFIRHAAKKGVEMMTFDNEDELYKISKFHPRAKMVLRILTDDSGSLCKLGLKFGSPLNKVKSLLLKAKELKVNVIGISFHVGSGCTNPLLFADAVARAKWAFEVGSSLGFKFTLLDVGGGFGGDNFVEIAGILRQAVEEHFPEKEGVRVIAEPGRYFVAEAFEMATNIIARRGKGISGSAGSSGMEDDVLDDDMDEEEEAMVMYYINDGVYGAFNCTMFDHQVVHPKVLTSRGSFISSPSAQFNSTTYEQCSIWGPTCDSIDCVSSKSYLPTNELDVGDWLRWENMGAYTICAASQFNGFKQSKVHYCVHAKKETERVIRDLLCR